MPSTSVFDRQLRVYRERVLPPALPCIAIEAGAPDLWRKYVGRSGDVIGIECFGESAPAGELFRHFGFTPERVVEAVKSLLARCHVEPKRTPLGSGLTAAGQWRMWE